MLSFVYLFVYQENNLFFKFISYVAFSVKRLRVNVEKYNMNSESVFIIWCMSILTYSAISYVVNLFFHIEEILILNLIISCI